MFSTIADQYSEIAWSERAEELNAEHNMLVVDSIKRFLSDGPKTFTMDQFSRRATGMAERDPKLMQVIKTLGIDRICRDLYHVNVIGQYMPLGTYVNEQGQTKRSVHETWFYRDNRPFDPTQRMVVHRALFPALKMSRWRAEDFGGDKRYVSDE